MRGRKKSGLWAGCKPGNPLASEPVEQLRDSTACFNNTSIIARNVQVLRSLAFRKLTRSLYVPAGLALPEEDGSHVERFTQLDGHNCAKAFGNSTGPLVGVRYLTRTSVTEEEIPSDWAQFQTSSRERHQAFSENACHRF